MPPSRLDKNILSETGKKANPAKNRFVILTGDNLSKKEKKAGIIHKKAKGEGEKQDFTDYI